MPLVSSIGLMLKEKLGEHVKDGFTAMNGRASPPSPRKTKGINGMTGDTIHLRTLSRNSSKESQDRKVALPVQDDPALSVRAPENGHQNGHRTDSPTTVHNGGTPESAEKRKRSSPVEDDSSMQSLEAPSAHSRRRLDSYASVGRDDSPNHTTSYTYRNILPATEAAMENFSQRSYPPIDRPGQGRNWPARYIEEPPGYLTSQHRDLRSREGSQEGINISPTSESVPIGHVPLQAKNRFAVELPQLYHSHPHPLNSLSNLAGT
ncbi:hypothetical protein K469DRAFT_748756 [Zopfia rhizophila CBS 207.26]|uniref:Uncharacterized protein n=1 Tax=Zopfia rhizophila CBS 207.26 TaxID=1314779 RepID=A0A6A6E805_9PEZI|nr:hypothetical protein K469DRAFT_748756 [Zopfia rhizophila CBS 207.26]